MKKSLLILCAAGAIALAGCAKTGFVSAPRETIGFRTTLASSTRATSTTTATLASFNAYAINHATSAVYFSDVAFTKGEDGTFTSAAEYIWPEGSLDFYAYSPVGNSQVVKGADCKTFTITPSATASEQVDFIYANTNGKTKDANADGVEINFRHTESQIALKVKNSSASLKFEVAGWKLAYLSKSGKFTYGDENTDTENTQLAKTDWSELGTAAVTNTYDQNLTSNVDVAAGATEATEIGESFILIPQSQTAAAGYESATEGAVADGSYIAVKFIIRNAHDDSVIYSDGADAPGAAWAMWPVDFDWEPGKKYTYIVDLSGCGYSETNTDGTNEDLDEVFEGTVIKFVDVTVDEFVTPDDIEVTMPEVVDEPEVETTTGTAKRNDDIDVNWVQLWENGPKFAEYNVGAANNKAEDYGGYYAWGGSQDRVDDHNDDNGPLTGFYDTATKLWGSNWRMPTQAELEGLLDNCTVQWTQVQGVNGRIFTGKTEPYSSNSVFLPAAGFCLYGNVYDQGSRGYYWSSTPDGSYFAYYLFFNSGGQFVHDDSRSYGYSVRAVLK